MSNEAGKTLKEAPKIGDRVTLPADYKGGGMWFLWLAGTSGRVTELEGSEATVKFDDGTEDYGRWHYLAPENTPTAPESLTHITINGTRYRLTPEPEGEPEQEPRQPQQGEVWRDVEDDAPLLITGCVDEDGDPQCVRLMSGDGGLRVGYTTHYDRLGVAFAFESLSAAIAAGAVK